MKNYHTLSKPLPFIIFLFTAKIALSQAAENKKFEFDLSALSDNSLLKPGQTSRQALPQLKGKEDCETGILTQRQKAIEYAEQLPAPGLDQSRNGFAFPGKWCNWAVKDKAGWETAIGNYKNVMKLNPIPPEDQWPIRGEVTKYNLFLLSVTSNYISRQEKNCHLKK